MKVILTSEGSSHVTVSLSNKQVKIVTQSHFNK